MAKRIFAITGATGHIGGRLTELLLAEGHAVRAIAHGGPKLQALASQGAEAHAGSVDDREFLTKALRGAEGVFAMVPPNFRAEDNRGNQRAVSDAEVAAIQAAGVKRVVALSSVGAQHERGTGPIAGLRYLEERLGALDGVDLASLRGAYFMENFLHNLGMIKNMGINGGAVAPDVSVPMVATQDIAAAAARHLSDADFSGKSVHYLLGARDLTFSEATHVLGEAIGRPDLPYVQFSYEDTRKALVSAGISPSVADDFVEMYRGFNDGLVRPTEPRSARNTTPTTLEAWSRDFAAAFNAAGSGT